MMRSLVLTLSIAAYTTAAAGQTTDRRPMTIDDALSMVTVGNVLLSPDGEQVLYSLTRLDWDQNKAETKFYMISAVGGEARQFIGDAGGSRIRFSPDGRHISLIRQVDGVSQIFRLPTDGGEAQQLTRHATSVGPYEWAADANTIFFVAPEPRTDDETKTLEVGDDAIFVDEGPNGQLAGQWRNLWAFDLTTTEEERLTNEELNLFEFEVSPTADRVLFTARRSSNRNDIHLNEIYLLSVRDKRIVQLTRNNAVEDSLQWAPDGRQFAFEADDDQEWTHKADKIWVMDATTREYRMVSGQFTEGRIARYWWSPDGRSITFSALQRTNSNLFHLDLISGDVTPITTATGRLNVSSLSADHTRMAYTWSDFDTPVDAYTSPVEAFEPVRLTDANPWVERDLLLATMQVIRWPSVKGLEIEGLLHLPPSYQPGTRLPLMVHIHGGPPGFFDNSFSVAHHIYAGLGYASLSPNVRGSAGYTDELREANTFYKGDGIGFGDYSDLMAGIDHVVDQGYADPDRLGVRGWSYGAILGGYTLTRTDRFKGAALGAGVYDWSAEYGPGYHWDVTRWYIGGTPWDNAEAWRRQSTITSVQEITTPTLLLHGMQDSTTTEPQSMMLYGALRAIGKAPVRYIRFPRETHGFREPRHNRVRFIEEFRWMERYVRGVEWEPWERLPQSESR